jgi:hypothetical protein
MSKVPLFSIFCIDFRFDALVGDFYEGIGRDLSYYACTVAGGAMPLGYKKYCKQVCNGCKNKSCNPSNSSMKLLKNNLVENLNIALTLSPITESFLLNHQDCGAIKGFLSCSGYPTVKGSNNKKEIEINESLLTYATKYMVKKFPKIKFILGLIDLNGYVATFDIITKTWTVIFISTGIQLDEKAFWYGLKVGSTYKN